MTDFTALGFDPVPGDVSIIDDLVERLKIGAEGLDDARAVLDGDDAVWEGKAAVAFRASVSEEFRPQVIDAGDALHTSCRALSRWSGQLVEFRRRAADLAEQATEASNRLERQREEQAAADDIDDQGASADSASAVSNAEAELEEIRAAARALQEETDDEAIRVAGELQAAGGSLEGYEESWWDKFVEGFNVFVAIVEDILRAVLPILAIISLFIPGLNILSAIILGMSIALVAIDTYQALTGQGSWSDAIVGAAGLLAGGMLGHLGKALGDGGKVIVGTINGGGGLAMAGGGTAAGAFSVTMALQINIGNLAANTYWAATTAKSAVDNGQGLVDSFLGPHRNLGERLDNLLSGNGPVTHEERR